MYGMFCTQKLVAITILNMTGVCGGGWGSYKPDFHSAHMQVYTLCIFVLFI